jgi:hypothetical protein
MVQAPVFLTHLVRTALGRGEAHPELSDVVEPVPEAPSVPTSGDDPTRAGAGSVSEAADPEFDPGITGVLAEKVLFAWLRNRYQLLFPFALDLRRLDKRQAELLVHAMIAASQADGSLDGTERKRIEGTLNLVDPNEDEHALLDGALRQPKPLNVILTDVHDVQTGALVYAASLMAVDQRKPVNRYYLKYLAARLQLSDELVDSLEKQYRSTG